MRKNEFTLGIAALLLTSALGRADFKFTQSGQVTGTPGGAKAIKAVAVTTYVKGSYLRIDLPDGSYGIVDLNGRRDIQVDSRNHTYSIVTFDAIRSDDDAYEKRVRRWGFNPRAVGKKELPSMTWTGKTQVLLGQTTRELALSIVTPARATAPQRPIAAYKIGLWVAGAVPGFNEVRDFDAKLAVTMSWAPVPTGTLKAFVECTWASTLFLFSLKPTQQIEGAIWVPMMTKGILDFYETNKEATGLPMLLSFRARFDPTPAQKQAAAGREQQTRSSQAGRVLRRSSGNSDQSMEFDIRTTSYSTGTLDRSLFQVPAGYALSPSSQANQWITSVGRNGSLLPLGM